MAIWYEVEHTDEGMRDFLDCNWGFHDFFIERFEYSKASNTVEIFLKYDELDGSVILRFLGVRSFREAEMKDKWDKEILGSVLVDLGDGVLIWVDDDSYGENSREHLDEIKEDSTWVEAEKIVWAVTDENGDPAEMPDDKLHQIWRIWGKREERNFSFKAFEGDWCNL